MIKASDDLRELVTHRGWEVLKRRAMGPWEGGESWKEKLQKRLQLCIDQNDMAGAKDYNGQIKTLDTIFGSAIPEWVGEMEAVDK